MRLGLAALVVLAASAHATCPNDCNGRGYCDGGAKELCRCEDAWADAPDCSRRACPLGTSWFDYPQPDGSAHKPDICSNRGHCDGQRGLCECADGFEGHACQRSVCPNDCSGHGKCVTIRERAMKQDYIKYKFQSRYESWDADMNVGCVCEDGWGGYDCSTRECPYGDDPLTTGQREVQTIRTYADHQDEVQVIEITADEDVDEVQVVRLTDASGGGSLDGSFRLRFDSSASGFCRICAIHSDSFTTDLPWDIVATGVGSMKERLEKINPDNIDEVTVTRTTVTDPGLEGYEWRITFTGLQVGGNVPQLVPVSVFLFGDAPNLTVWTDTNGNEVGGIVTLFYDDIASRPPGTFGVSNTTINAFSTAVNIRTQLELMENMGAVGVQTLYVGGPGLAWRVTFTRNLGDMSQLFFDDSNLTEFAPPTTNPRANITTEVNGYFLEGSFIVKYGTRQTAPLAWNTSREDMALAIDDLDSIFSGVNVTRELFYQTRTRPWEWTGQYSWHVTFVGMKFDLPTDLRVEVNSTFLYGANNEYVRVGTAESKVSGIETNPLNVETNEIQILDCVCPGTCSGGWNFSFYGHIVPMLYFNSTPDDLIAALASLPEIDFLAVSQFNSDLGTLCDSDGVSTLITFTHNPGDIPPLVVSNAPGTFTLRSDLDPGASSLIIRHGDYHIGTHGGMSRDGSRILIQCSARGVCTSSGECVCYDGWGDSDGASIHLDVGFGTRKDCSHNLRYLDDCPLGCLNRGFCRFGTLNCDCDPPYTGPACEQIICPQTLSWFDEANGDTSNSWYGAHRMENCGGKGVCDTSIGKCRCEQGFQGVACQRTSCVGTSLKFGQGGEELYVDQCNGHGMCLNMDQMANISRNYLTDDGYIGEGIRYTEWDALKNYGCACNRSRYIGKYDQEFRDFFGFDCTKAECAKTADPKDHPGQYERQRITCSATAGTFRLEFLGSRSIRIPVNARTYGKNNFGEYVETINSVRDVVIRPVPLNDSSAFVYDTMEVVDEFGNVSTTTFIFNSSCSERLPDSRDYTPACTADRLFDAECWPFPTVCGVTSSGEPFSIDITFIAEHGDIPLMKIVDVDLLGSVSIEEVTPGSLEPKECSGRGACDFDTGRCICAAQYGSSDGRFESGDLGDCGHLHAHYNLPLDLLPGVPTGA